MFFGVFLRLLFLYVFQGKTGGLIVVFRQEYGPFCCLDANLSGLSLPLVCLLHRMQDQRKLQCVVLNLPEHFNLRRCPRALQELFLGVLPGHYAERGIFAEVIFGWRFKDIELLVAGGNGPSDDFLPVILKGRRESVLVPKQFRVSIRACLQDPVQEAVALPVSREGFSEDVRLNGAYDIDERACYREDIVRTLAVYAQGFTAVDAEPHLLIRTLAVTVKASNPTCQFIAIQA